MNETLDRLPGVARLLAVCEQITASTDDADESAQPSPAFMRLRGVLDELRADAGVQAPRPRLRLIQGGRE